MVEASHRRPLLESVRLSTMCPFGFVAGSEPPTVDRRAMDYRPFVERLRLVERFLMQSTTERGTGGRSARRLFNAKAYFG